MADQTRGPETRGPDGQFAVFSVAGVRLALPAAAIRRFLPLPRLDRLPTAPSPVEGVFRYRGELVPVLRLAGLLGLPDRDAGLYAPLLLIARSGGPAALLAGRVELVLSIPAERMMAADPALSFNGCAVGAFVQSGATVTVLAPDRLLTGSEERLLDAFRQAEALRLEQWGGVSA